MSSSSSSSTTTILLSGATGLQGAKVLATLREHPNYANFTIRFITRDPASTSAQKLIQQGLTAYKADLTDETALITALTGVDRAYLVTPPFAGEKDAKNGEAREVLQGKTFIEAAKKAQVKHVVFSSVSGSNEAKTVPHFRSKWEIEKILHASGLAYTIIRPAAFMENFPTAPGIARFMMVGVFFAATGGKKVKFVATEDIGVFVAKALLNPQDEIFHNKTIELAGGEYGLEDVRQAFGNVEGKQPWFASWMPEFVRNAFPFDLRQMMLYFKNQGYPEVDYTALKRIHPGLKTFEDFVRSAQKNKSA